MKPRDLADLVLLAALWGASFLFMRVAAPHFGPVPLSALRVAGAALLLLPLLAAHSGLAGLRKHWRPIALVGVTNSALPFVGFSVAALYIPAGLSSILNATSPMFGALIAMLWLREPSSLSRVAGLGVGFVGVMLLARDSTRFATGDSGAGLAIGLCLAASLLYGFSACLARRYLAQRRAAGRGCRQPGLGCRGAGMAGMVGLAGSSSVLGALAGGAGAGAVLHRHRLHPVFPADCPRRAGTRDCRDLPGAGLRHALGRPLPG